VDITFDPNCRRHRACGSPLAYDNRTESKKVNPKYNNITVQLTGQDGNAFAIMAKVSGALRKESVPESEVEQYLSESMSGDYDALLRTAMSWVNVT
jgi:hypothetical protein